MSWGVIMPRSPWLASPGCMKNAGVPVDASVEAILRPIWPDLPMPVTTTRPFVFSSPTIMRWARRNPSPRRPFSARTASASMSSTSRARARKRSASAIAWACRSSAIDPEYKSIAHETSPVTVLHDALPVALILLASAVVVVVLFRQLSIPAILGYLLVGAVIGPGALALVPDTDTQRYLAEFGVVFLMFSVGLEFSLPQLTAMRRIVFGFGGAQ